MQNVLKHLNFLLSVIFLTEALHGQSKTSQNPKSTMAISAHPPQTRSFNSDRPNNQRNNEYNLERDGDHYSQSNRPSSSSYKQYKSNPMEGSARNPLSMNEEKTFANNREEQDQRFVEPHRHRQEINSYYQEDGGSNPHRTTNSKSIHLQGHTSRTNQMNRGEYLPPHEHIQDKKVQRPIRLFPDPYNRALEKHLQKKGERPVYEDYPKAPVNSRKALIHEEASEENSQWHESEDITSSTGRNNNQQEIHSYQPRNQFQIRELQSSQQSHFNNRFSSNPSRPSNSDPQTNYRQHFRPSQGTSRSGSHLGDLENDDLRDSVRKHQNADISQQDSLGFRENFSPSKGNPRSVLRSSELRNDDMRNSFTGHSNENPSMQENLHLRQKYPPSEETSRPVIQSDSQSQLQSDDFPDSYSQHSNRDSSAENNFNSQMSGRNRSPYSQNSPDFEHRSTNKEYPNQRQHNPLPPPVERPYLKENSKSHASNEDNLFPRQRLPHSDEDLPSNYNVYSNDKTPSSYKSIQNSNPLPSDKNPNYPERQQQSEGVYSDFSDEYSPISPQNNKNSGSTFRTSSRNGQGKNQQETPQYRELHRDYSNGQSRNHQELSHSREPQMDYSKRQSRNHQELPRAQELHTGYSNENSPNFHQSSYTNGNSQTQLIRENIPVNYHEPTPHSQGLEQKYSDENLPTNSGVSRTSKIPYVRSFTEGRHLGHQESFQYLPEKPEFDDISLNKKKNPSTSHSENIPVNKKGRKVAIGDYSVENQDAQPVEYHSPQNFQDSPSRTRGNKHQGRVESLQNEKNSFKEQTVSEAYSPSDSRLPVVEGKQIHKSRASRQRTAQRSSSPVQNIKNLPVKRSSEDDSTVKNLTFSATVERDHIISMGSEQEPDSEPEPEERDHDDDDFGEEQHDGFLDMGAYTDKQGSFGWYADFPVGRGHDKVSYSSS